MINCKYIWLSKLDETLVCGEYYYYEIVNSCNFPYAVFNNEKVCIDCYRIKDFNKRFIVTIKENRKQKLKKINESR